MKPVQILSASAQVAAELKKRILDGQFQGSMLGVSRLSKLLGVNAKVVASALNALENEGVLLNQGPRKKRLITIKPVGSRQTFDLGRIRLGLLLYEPGDRRCSLVLGLEHALNEVGHRVTYAGKTLTELKMDLRGVEKQVRAEQVDAWVVISGSREILQWFSEYSLPAFAIFGRRTQVKLPSVGPKLDEAFTTGVQQLIDLGHRRIVKICRSERRLPNPGRSERLFLTMLDKNEIPVGDFNLPSWEETPEGLQELLCALFSVTPPTALIVDEPLYLMAVLQFLSEKGLQAPKDVSLFCLSADSCLDWCRPSVACIRWETGPIIRRVLRWANNVANRQEDFEQIDIPAILGTGGTIGPVLREKS